MLRVTVELGPWDQVPLELSQCLGPWARVHLLQQQDLRWGAEQQQGGLSNDGSKPCLGTQEQGSGQRQFWSRRRLGSGLPDPKERAQQ